MRRNAGWWPGFQLKQMAEPLRRGTWEEEPVFWVVKESRVPCRTCYCESKECLQVELSARQLENQEAGIVF